MRDLAPVNQYLAPVFSGQLNSNVFWRILQIDHLESFRVMRGQLTINLLTVPSYSAAAFEVDCLVFSFESPASFDLETEVLFMEFQILGQCVAVGGSILLMQLLFIIPSQLLAENLT